MHLAQLPGVKADTPGSRAEFDRLKRHGYHWINFQTVNGPSVKDFRSSVAEAKAAGLAAGVWGVVYSTADFYEFGKRLARSAVEHGAQHLTVDAEDCLKNTRGTGWVRDHLLKGIREAGWGGPVHLNTLAAPSDPMRFDFGYDVASFIATGGGVFAQCYVGLHPGYHPACARHYYVERMGVPATHFNATISVRRHDRSAYFPNEGLLLSPAEWKAILLNPADPTWMERLNIPAEWRPMMERATFQRNLSLYLLSDIDPAGGDAGLEQLDYFTLHGGEPLPQPQPEPEPEPQPEPAPEKSTYQIGQEIRAEMIALANAMEEVWRNDGKTQAVIDAQRITIARHILETGAEWGDVRAEIKRLLGLA